MSRFPNLFFWIAVFAATVCGTVHLATFAGYAFYGVIYFVLLLFVVWPLVIFRWRRQSRQFRAPTFYLGYSKTLTLLAVACLAYVFINYFLCRSLNDSALPVQMPDGRLVLQAGAKIVRVLDAEGYRHAQAVQVRMLSGHLLGFYALAAVALRICARAEKVALEIVEATLKRG